MQYSEKKSGLVEGRSSVYATAYYSEKKQVIPFVNGRLYISTIRQVRYLYQF